MFITSQAKGMAFVCLQAKCVGQSTSGASWRMQKHVLGENCEERTWQEEVSSEAMPCLRSPQEKKPNKLHLQVLCNATPQRGVFPEISHTQALLGALVKCFLKVLVHKNN
jgi:hypothetical protein